MDADALATSGFVMVPVAGVQFINRQPDCECFVIGKNGDLSHSKGLAGEKYKDSGKLSVLRGAGHCGLLPCFLQCQLLKSEELR